MSLSSTDIALLCLCHRDAMWHTLLLQRIAVPVARGRDQQGSEAVCVKHSSKVAANSCTAHVQEACTRKESCALPGTCRSVRLKRPRVRRIVAHAELAQVRCGIEMQCGCQQEHVVAVLNWW